jgi:hypothetical protein
MKAREDFTLGRWVVDVCGLSHPRPMFLEPSKITALPLEKTADTSSLCLRQVKEVPHVCCMMDHRLWPFFHLR